MSCKKRVVITGYGTVNPLGYTVDSFWDYLTQGKSGISTIDTFDIEPYPCHIAGLIRDFDLSKHFTPKELKRTSKFILYALYAAQQALNQSGLDIKSICNDVGVEIGSGIGGLDILEKMAVTVHQRGPAKVSPFTVPMMICDMAAGQVAIATGAKGPNACTVTACASSAHSIGNAYHLISQSKAIAMIAGGSESCITPLGMASFGAARSLSTNNAAPTKASRPFDLNRDGFVMGEGAGILVLEELEYAKKRGAHIIAEMVGFASTGDAYHMTAPAPEGEGAQRALNLILKEAALNPEDVHYYNAHGTSTSLNDKNETAALKAVFKDYAYKLPISSTKSMTGHLLGAAASLEAIACIKAIETGIIPPTINYDTPDPDCDLNYTPNQAIERKVDCAVSSSFGFGGHNAVLAFKSYKD